MLVCETLTARWRHSLLDQVIDMIEAGRGFVLQEDIQFLLDLGCFPAQLSALVRCGAQRSASESCQTYCHFWDACDAIVVVSRDCGSHGTSLLDLRLEVRKSAVGDGIHRCVGGRVVKKVWQNS